MISVLMLILWGQSWAGPMPRSTKKTENQRTSIIVYWGVGSYKMGDINELLDDANAWMGGNYIDPINSGTEVGGRMIYDFENNLSLGFSANNIDAETRNSGSVHPLFIDVSAHVYELVASYELHHGELFNAGIGASLGFIMAHGQVEETTHGGDFYRNSFEGSSTTANGFALAEIGMFKRTWLLLEAGYRHAEIESVVWDNGNHFTNSAGEKISLSYSGFFARAGIRVALDFFFLP